MQAAGLRKAVILDELESHLRDDVAQRVRAGMAAGEAFEAAVGQMGSAAALRAEFEKIRWFTPAHLRRWGMIGFGLELTAYTLLQLHQLWKATPSGGELTLGLLGLAATLAAAYGIWQLAPKVMGRIANQTVRSSIVVAGCLSAVTWLLAFAWFILPELTLTPGQFAVVFLWAMLPMVVVPAIATGLDPGEARRAG